MTEIVFNARNNGACAFCKKNKKCHILIRMEEAARDEVKNKFDDRMEIVIYRCPEFEEV